MKFDDQCEKLLNHYINEGIGTAIKDTLTKNFVDPFKEMNPWRSKFGNWANDRAEKRDAWNEYNPNQKGKVGQGGQASPTQQYIHEFQIKGLKSSLTPRKEITFIDRGTVLGKFQLNCSGLLSNKINSSNLLISNPPVTPDINQKTLGFIALYDLRNLRLIDSSIEKDFSTEIRSNLLKDRVDPAQVGNKTTEALNEFKQYINSIFIPLDVRTQMSMLYEKIVWFFIFTRATQLKS